jgi:hypothetical protein
MMRLNAVIGQGAWIISSGNSSSKRLQGFFCHRTLEKEKRRHLRRRRGNAHHHRDHPDQLRGQIGLRFACPSSKSLDLSPSSPSFGKHHWRCYRSWLLLLLLLLVSAVSSAAKCRNRRTDEQPNVPSLFFFHT